MMVIGLRSGHPYHQFEAHLLFTTEPLIELHFNENRIDIRLGVLAMQQSLLAQLLRSAHSGFPNQSIQRHAPLSAIAASAHRWAQWPVWNRQRP